MDGYTIGLILKQLLASAGLRSTLAIVAVLGVVWVFYRGLSFGAASLAALIAARDAERAAFLATMERMLNAADLRASQQDIANRDFQHNITLIQERILDTTLDSQAVVKEFRAEDNERYLKINNDLNTIVGWIPHRDRPNT